MVMLMDCNITVGYYKRPKPRLTIPLPCLTHTPWALLSLAATASNITALSLLAVASAALSPSSRSQSRSSLEVCWTALMDNFLLT